MSHQQALPLLPLLPLLLLLSAASCQAAAHTLRVAVVFEQQEEATVRTAVQLAESQLLHLLQGSNATFLLRPLLPTEDLQDVAADVCSWLPVHAVLDFSAAATSRCLCQSLAQLLQAAYVSGQQPAQAAAVCSSWPAVTLRYSAAAFLDGVWQFAEKLNFSVKAAALLYDSSWDAAAVLPTGGFSSPLYLFRLPGNDSDLAEFLVSVRKRTDANLFVLATQPESVATVMDAADSLKLTWRFYSWFFLNPGVRSPRVRQLVRQVTWLPANTSGVALQQLQNSSSLVSLLTKVDALKLLFATAGSALNAGSELGSQLANRDAGNCSTAAAANRSYSVYQQFTAAAANASYLGLELGTVKLATEFDWPLVPNVTVRLHTCVGGGCQATSVGYSSENRSLVQLPDGSASAIQLAAPQLHLHVLTVTEPPFVYNESGNYTGYAIAVLSHISKQLDFNYTITMQSDKSYGLQLSDGSWNGMIGSVARMEADLAIGPISVTTERQQVVDFTIPFYDYAGLQILMLRAGDSGTTGMFFFFSVFDNYVWLFLVLTLVVTGVLVTLFDKLSPYSFQNRQNSLPEGEPEGKVFTFKESMWFVLGACTQAGESFDPRATSTRFLVAGFWIFSYIVMSLYTANLAAFLTVSKLTASISTISELAGQTNLKYSVARNTIGHTFFERMRGIESKFYEVWRDISVQTEFTADKGSMYTVWEYPIEERFTDMYRRMSNWGLFNSTEEAIQLVKTGKWAMFMETPLIKYHMGKDCDLVNTGQVLSSRPYGIALQKNSPLTSLINMAILEMQRDRVLENLKVSWWEKEKISCPKTETTTGIKLRTLSGVFVFLGGGIVLGFIVLIVELVVAKVWGAERFKPDSVMVSHLAPRPASTRRTVRLESARDDSKPGLQRNRTEESSLSATGTKEMSVSSFTAAQENGL